MLYRLRGAAVTGRNSDRLEFHACVLHVAARETTSCPPSFVFLVSDSIAICAGMSEPEELVCELVLENNG